MHECLLCNRDMKISKDTFGNGCIKNILITLIIIIGLVILIDVIIIIDNDIQMNECLEIVVPKLTKREIVKLQNTDLFNDEKVIKIYLSKNQTQNILKKIEENVNLECTMQSLLEYLM